MTFFEVSVKGHSRQALLVEADSARAAALKAEEALGGRSVSVEYVIDLSGSTIQMVVGACGSCGSAILEDDIFHDTGDGVICDACVSDPSQTKPPD